MRRGLFILATFILVMAASGQDAHAWVFGTKDTVHHLQPLKEKGPNGEPLVLGFLTSTHAFLLPYSMSDGGYVIVVKSGSSNTFYRLPTDKIEQFQRSGALPTPLPVYRKTTIDYLGAYVLWWAIPGVLFCIWICSMLGIGSGSTRGETRPA
jgi:hypothetical protein